MCVYAYVYNPYLSRMDHKYPPTPLGVNQAWVYVLLPKKVSSPPPPKPSQGHLSDPLHLALAVFPIMLHYKFPSVMFST